MQQQVSVTPELCYYSCTLIISLFPVGEAESTEKQKQSLKTLPLGFIDLSAELSRAVITSR